MAPHGHHHPLEAALKAASHGLSDRDLADGLREQELLEAAVGMTWLS